MDLLFNLLIELEIELVDQVSVQQMNLSCSRWSHSLDDESFEQRLDTRIELLAVLVCFGSSFEYFNELLVELDSLLVGPRRRQIRYTAL